MIDNEFLNALKELLGSDRVLTEPEDMFAYSYDSNTECKFRPDVVASPESAEEISAIMKLAGKYNIPVTPRGSATNFTAGSLAVGGGLVLTTDRLNRILEIDRENFLVIVEPGVLTAKIQEAVAPFGLMYPPDPASVAFSTIGGNIAENAGGIRAVKYGVTKNYVMGLEVVLPNGEIIHTGSKCIKDVVGLNLTELFVGSEGTLGIITKAIIRVIPKPQARRIMTATFESLDAAAVAVRNIFATGVRPSILEFLDRNCVEAVDKVANLGAQPNEGAMLLIEVDGGEAQVDVEMERIEKVCHESGVITFRKARTEKDMDTLWHARHALPMALMLVNGRWKDDDISVPMSRIPDMVKKITETAKKYDVQYACFGHFGDGNIHQLLACREAERPFPQEARSEVYRAVCALEGRIAAEHGTGFLKANKLCWNLDLATVDFIRTLKKAIDPKGIMNPHKILPGEKSS